MLSIISIMMTEPQFRLEYKSPEAEPLFIEPYSFFLSAVSVHTEGYDFNYVDPGFK